MIGRLVHTVDIASALAAPPRLRSAHFAVHHLAASPSRHLPASVQKKLSTAEAHLGPQAVDKSPAGHWVGALVPKRHARRAVTRSLLKRQMRAALQRHAGALQPGLWLVRLRSPFATASFPAAGSPALAAAARDELDRLLSRAAA